MLKNITYILSEILSQHHVIFTENIKKELTPELLEFIKLTNVVKYKIICKKMDKFSKLSDSIKRLESFREELSKKLEFLE